jgi:peroxiredoxin
LNDRAKEFIGDKSVPDNFHIVTDPDYKFTNAYHLRWEKPRETAYPSTFVIDAEGKIRFAKISQSHGDRAKAKDVLAELKKL